jgi:hypothetical protein
LLGLGFRECDSLRESCNSDIEIVAIFSPNVLNEVDTVLETTFDRCPFFLS